jgi:hypothetical protein
MKTMQVTSYASTRPVVPFASPETQRLMMLGQERGWDFMVLGQAPLPTEPVRLHKWLIVPVEQDTSHIPPRALERVQAIYAASLRPKGFVVVHEAPMALSSARSNEPHFAFPKLTAVLPVMEGVLGGVVAAGLVAIAAAITVAVPLTLVAGALLLDPILIAVTEDGDWIEIDRWWNEPSKGVK